jgi:hypothetical protein
MNTMVKWVFGIFFALLTSSFTYTTLMDNSLRSYIQENASRLESRLDHIDNKLDRLIERQH